MVIAVTQHGLDRPCALEIEMGIMLPRETDAAMQLDSLFQARTVDPDNVG